MMNIGLGLAAILCLGMVALMCAPMAIGMIRARPRRRAAVTGEHVSARSRNQAGAQP
jgi:hypothetical protein